MRKKIIFFTLLLCYVSWGENISLKIAENRAVNNGFDIKIDSLDNIARSWQEKNVVAGYLPTLDYGLNLIRMDDSSAFYAGFTGVSPVISQPNVLSHEFKLSQPITNGGAEVVAIKMAKHTRKAQEFGYKAKKSELILSVRKSYFELLKIREQIKIAIQDLDWANQSLAVAQSKFESGVLPQTDLLRWQREVIDKQAFLKQSEALNQYQQANLKVFMGEDPTSDYTIEPDSFSIYESYFLNFKLDSGTIDSNQQLQSLNSYREISHDETNLSLTSVLPKINGFGSWKKDLKWGEGTDLNKSYNQWNIGVGLSVPLFSGFRNSTRFLESKYDAIKADIDYSKNRNVMAANLIRIKQFMIAAKIGAESSKKQFDLNLKNFEIMNDRYILGLSSQLDLLEMNRALAGSRLDYVTQTLETLYYYSEYQNAIGKLEVIQ